MFPKSTRSPDASAASSSSSRTGSGSSGRRRRASGRARSAGSSRERRGGTGRTDAAGSSRTRSPRPGWKDASVGKQLESHAHADRVRRDAEVGRPHRHAIHRPSRRSAAASSNTSSHVVGIGSSPKRSWTAETCAAASIASAHWWPAYSVARRGSGRRSHDSARRERPGRRASPADGRPCSQRRRRRKGGRSRGGRTTQRAR